MSSSADEASASAAGPTRTEPHDNGRTGPASAAPQGALPVALPVVLPVASPETRPGPAPAGRLNGWWRRLRGVRAAGEASGRTPPLGLAASAGFMHPAGRADRRLRHLEWTTLRRLDGLLQGDYRTLMRGLGLDLADLREYQPGDDVRHIDWNVTARLQTPHVRRFHESRDMTVWLLLDLSPSMHFGSDERTKFDQAVDMAAVLARLFTGHGNRVGAIVYGRTEGSAQRSDQVLNVLPPRSGRQQVLSLMDAMQRTGDAAASTPAPGGSGSAWWRRWSTRKSGTASADTARASDVPATTQLADLLRAGGQVLRSRSSVVVLSDFISAPGWESPLGLLQQRHDVLCVRLTDPVEQALPDLGLVTLRDAETGEHLLVDVHDPAFRSRYAALAQEAELALRGVLQRAGVDALELDTAADVADTLAQFCALRRQRSRLSGGASQRFPLNRVVSPRPQPAGSATDGSHTGTLANPGRGRLTTEAPGSGLPSTATAPAAPADTATARRAGASA